MKSTPKSLRLAIGIFGRTNVGKSSLVNYITDQDIAITSSIAGTTTDVVEKPMEFAPAGPVLFIDTAGLDDTSQLGGERACRSIKVFDRSNIALLVTTPNIWGDTEEKIISTAAGRKIPVIIVVNKSDTVEQLEPDFQEKIARFDTVVCSTVTPEKREKFLHDFRKALLKNLPESFVAPPPLLGDLLEPGDLAVMIVPIDLQAPRGRLILPQVQAIRDALDNDAMLLVTKEDHYPELIKKLQPEPKLVICDSQVVKMMIENTPSHIACTTFSVLFSRLKGDTKIFLEGCNAIKNLQDGDRVLIAEACTHHPTCEDIGRVKIPNLLKKATQKELIFEFAPGRDFPADLSSYSLIVHCGSCMLNRQETLYRISQAQNSNVPITNYGMAISYCQGVLDKVLIPK